jgi:hypothetical protein
MPNPATASYRDAAGGRHDIVVRETAGGAWEILDTTPDRTRVVDTLSGYDEGRPHAEAVARDYADQHARERPDRARREHGADGLAA